MIRPAMTRLSNGGFAVVWADKRENERIRVQRFGLSTELKRARNFAPTPRPGCIAFQ